MTFSVFTYQFTKASLCQTNDMRRSTAALNFTA